VAVLLWEKNTIPRLISRADKSSRTWCIWSICLFDLFIVLYTMIYSGVSIALLTWFVGYTICFCLRSAPYIQVVVMNQTSYRFIDVVPAPPRLEVGEAHIIVVWLLVSVSLTVACIIVSSHVRCRPDVPMQATTIYCLLWYICILQHVYSIFFTFAIHRIILIFVLYHFEILVCLLHPRPSIFVYLQCIE
jgi:hypothetical protein